MHSNILKAAAISALATSAAAYTDPVPYALSAEHADLLFQLNEVAALPDEIGLAARHAAMLMTQQNAAQERLVLPLVGWAEAATSRPGKDAIVAASVADNLDTELSRLLEGDVELVTALVELFALAESADQPEIARLAERMIWHETVDVEIHYPAALLISQRLQTR